MTKTEQVTIKALIKRLRSSSVSGWQEGNVNDWADYAKTMATTIRTSCDVLEEISNLKPENESNDNLTL